MSHQQAASVVALRRLVESVIIQIANDPQFIEQVPQPFMDVLNVIRMLSRSDAGNFQVTNESGMSNHTRDGQPFGSYPRGRGR